MRDIQSAEGYQFGNKRREVGAGQICLREWDIQKAVGNSGDDVILNRQGKGGSGAG